MVAKYRPAGNHYFQAVVTKVFFVRGGVRYYITWEDDDDLDRIKVNGDLDVDQDLKLIRNNRKQYPPLPLIKSRVALQARVEAWRKAEGYLEPEGASGAASVAAPPASPAARGQEAQVLATGPRRRRA